MSQRARAISFFLPQYHPFPENDRHWGTGFTEWNNVVRARPLFPGHHQPQLPADLGFYDLRVPEVRAQQRDLALAAGIEAFALYHYWFHGRRLMQRPIEEFFADPPHEVRYLLCWANESWTLEWRGRDDVATLEQTYSPEDDAAHAEHLAAYFANERYYRLDGKAVFLVYNPHHLPDAKATVDVLRSAAARVGVELLLGGCVAFAEDVDVREWGLDFSVRWAPNWLTIQRAPDERREKLMKLESKLLAKRWPRFRNNTVYDYARVRDAHVATPRPAWPTCESAFPSWDNTARRAHGDAIIVTEPTPDGFEQWLRSIVARQRPQDPPLVFVNAWNEWAEGCHLEPDDRWGHEWLNRCRAVFGAAAH
ncbi:glycoside hydrolase family 99-like domain-containing protein [uncultured Jatrophihabitans sp.]|uniref:glycosyltransferase WbsX family protein n=1 Tax=uncultured Jatrophihabitans sp. TaxID=1610747 RepID=UPI0035CB8CAE